MLHITIHKFGSTQSEVRWDNAQLLRVSKLTIELESQSLPLITITHFSDDIPEDLQVSADKGYVIRYTINNPEVELMGFVRLHRVTRDDFKNRLQEMKTQKANG